MVNRNRHGGMSQITLLVSIAVLLAVAYVGLLIYSGGQKDMVTVEARGGQMVNALSAFKRDQGSYPDALAKLVPKYAPGVAKCPGGAPMEYRVAAGEYALSCADIVFKALPYNYDSRSKRWGG